MFLLSLAVSNEQGLEMFVKMFTVGTFAANCFLVADTETKEALIIDPGFDGELEAKSIMKEIEQNGLQVKYIVNTHGHPDHVSGNAIMKKLTKAPILIGEYDSTLLSSPPDRKLHDGDLIQVGSVNLRVIHTPGHSKGSVILLGTDSVFAGDTLFAGSIGRYDLPGGSLDEIQNSLRNKLMTLPDQFKVYPGHGPVTTIGEERKNNPFLQDFNWELF